MFDILTTLRLSRISLNFAKLNSVETTDFVKYFTRKLYKFTVSYVRDGNATTAPGRHN